MEADSRRYCKQRGDSTCSSLIRWELKVQCLPVCLLLNASRVRARACACCVRVRCRIVSLATLTTLQFFSVAVQLGSGRRLAMLYISRLITAIKSCRCRERPRKLWADCCMCGALGLPCLTLSGFKFLTTTLNVRDSATFVQVIDVELRCSLVMTGCLILCQGC